MSLREEDQRAANVPVAPRLPGREPVHRFGRSAQVPSSLQAGGELRGLPRRSASGNAGREHGGAADVV